MAKTKSCDKCKEDGFAWKKNQEGRWQLWKDGVFHECATCKLCEKVGLHWRETSETKSGFALYEDDGSPHRCHSGSDGGNALNNGDGRDHQEGNHGDTDWL